MIEDLSNDIIMANSNEDIIENILSKKSYNIIQLSDELVDSRKTIEKEIDNPYYHLIKKQRLFLINTFEENIRNMENYYRHNKIGMNEFELLLNSDNTGQYIKIRVFISNLFTKNNLTFYFTDFLHFILLFTVAR